MSGVIYKPDTPETRYEHQRLARLLMITRLETDILADMRICDIEGWDKMEYIRMLRNLLNGLGGEKE